MPHCTHGQWEEVQESDTLNLNIVSVSYQLCDRRQIV